MWNLSWNYSFVHLKCMCFLYTFIGHFSQLICLVSLWHLPFGNLVHETQDEYPRKLFPLGFWFQLSVVDAILFGSPILAWGPFPSTRMGTEHLCRIKRCSEIGSSYFLAEMKVDVHIRIPKENGIPARIAMRNMQKQLFCGHGRNVWVRLGKIIVCL